MAAARRCRRANSSDSASSPARSSRVRHRRVLISTTTDPVNPDAASRSQICAQGWFPHHANLTPENVAQTRALGLKCGCWTVNDADDMKRIARLKPDAICSDRPKLLKAVLDAIA